MNDKEERFSHPSYGMIGISRRSGLRGRLYGSAITDHYSTISIQVRSSERIHDLSYDRYRGKDRLIEIELSASQFAEFITTPNVGDGVPCTIRSINGQRVPNPPEELLEAEKIRSDFEEKARGIALNLKEMKNQVATLMNEKKNLNREDRAAILMHFDKAIMEVSSNLPFVLDQFHEATDKITSAAKAEIDSFVTHNTMLAGIKALQEKAAQKDIPLLVESGSDDE